MRRVWRLCSKAPMRSHQFIENLLLSVCPKGGLAEVVGQAGGLGQGLIETRALGDVRQSGRPPMVWVSRVR